MVLLSFHVDNTKAVPPSLYIYGILPQSLSHFVINAASLPFVFFRSARWSMASVAGTALAVSVRPPRRLLRVGFAMHLVLCLIWICFCIRCLLRGFLVGSGFYCYSPYDFLACRRMTVFFFICNLFMLCFSLQTEGWFILRVELLDGVECLDFGSVCYLVVTFKLIKQLYQQWAGVCSPCTMLGNAGFCLGWIISCSCSFVFLDFWFRLNFIVRRRCPFSFFP